MSATASPLAELVPLLDGLSTQSEAVAAKQAMPSATDAIRDDQRDGWRHVLESFVRGESLEADFMAPGLAGLARVGLDHPEVMRFYRLHAEDEARHMRLVATYLEAHYGERPLKVSFVTSLLYDHVLTVVARRAERQPLYLMVPILVLERSISTYLARLARCAGDAGMTVLQGVFQDIHRDEARHVAAVNATCRLLLARPTSRRERRVLRLLAWIVAKDMDRCAWWKPGLARRMAAIGLDAAAMDRDNAAILADVLGMLAEPEGDRGDRHAAV